MSEIDDIFSMKSSKSTEPVISMAENLKGKDRELVSKKKKKKDKKLNKSAAAALKNIDIESKEPANDVLATKVQVFEHLTNQTTKRPEDEDGWADSRGNGQRKQTEDGFDIYTEEELGMNQGGVDTPDCPFDCKCCY